MNIDTLLCQIVYYFKGSDLRLGSLWNNVLKDSKSSTNILGLVINWTSKEYQI